MFCLPLAQRNLRDDLLASGGQASGDYVEKLTYLLNLREVMV